MTMEIESNKRIKLEQWIYRTQELTKNIIKNLEKFCRDFCERLICVIMNPPSSLYGHQ